MIVLAGFMGAGKTTIGRRLARAIGSQFVDTDRMIEKRSGMEIREIFSVAGEGAFRRLETAALRLAVSRGSGVVSVGGGALGRLANRRILKMRENAIVYLDAPFSVISGRINRSGQDVRPVWSRRGSGGQRLLFGRRTALYKRCSDISVSTGGRSGAEIVRDILSKLELKGSLGINDHSSETGRPLVQDPDCARLAGLAARSSMVEEGQARRSHKSKGASRGR